MREQKTLQKALQEGEWVEVDVSDICAKVVQVVLGCGKG